MTAKKTHGVVYTPRWIVDLILNESGFDGERGNIIDPACGDGAFLCVAAERIIAASGKGGDALRRELESRIVGADVHWHLINARAGCRLLRRKAGCRKCAGICIVATCLRRMRCGNGAGVLILSRVIRHMCAFRIWANPAAAHFSAIGNRFYGIGNAATAICAHSEFGRIPPLFFSSRIPNSIKAI